jgi:hypothetical protein
MNKYRVFGDKLVSYYAVVSADNEEHAYEYASNNDNIEWFQIPTDSTIEVHFVEAEQDTSNLLEDGYPSMDNDVIIVDKSDNTDI